VVASLLGTDKSNAEFGEPGNVRACIVGYVRPPEPPPGKEIRSQFILESLARKQYKETILEGRIPG